MNTNILYYPKIDTQFTESIPESFNWAQGSRPSENFVVSRNIDGSVASIYSDYTWDLSAYDSQENTLLLSFESWIEDTPTKEQTFLVNEIKWILFIFIWIRDGSISTRSIYPRYLVLRKIARYVESQSKTIGEFLYEPRLINEFLQDRSAIKLTVLPTMLYDLMKLGREITGFQLVGGNTLKELRKFQSRYIQNFQQHSVIPSRIYIYLMQQFNLELDEFELVADKLGKLVKSCVADPLFGLSPNSQYRKAKKIGIEWTLRNSRPTFPQLVRKCDLQCYFDSWEERTGQSVNSTQALSSYLVRILYTCKYVIHLYSGMRKTEVMKLPYHCVEKFRTHGKNHYRIKGQSTKLNRGIPLPAIWVTSIEGIRAVKLAQRISSMVYHAIGVRPSKSKNSIYDFPLFISLGYLNFTNSPSEIDDSRGYLAQFLSKKLIEYMPHLIPAIEDSDICELENIEPHRAWRSEDKYRVGTPWPLTTHQFRRSLAVYASNSGLVSLPSLRRNLQHLTEEMSTYYARGSSFAKNLIKNNHNHFAREYQNTQPESQALAYLSQVIFSDEKLFGPHGTWIERNVRTKNAMLSESERKETIKRFEKGEISYSETHLGGCTEIGPCDKKAMRSIMGCLDCSRSVIKLSKLDRLIKVQKSFVDKLDTDTMEWRVESSDLEAMHSYRAKIKRKGAFRE